ncbi:MAG: hypothetical protein Sylvanvirus26_6 [Sylvanvirus sp.]|uniref:Uncharacterized protein n=1 Tax=Sylvanvirus sp. TaxID=2487774 RepID=A0A3G5AIX6_9VIRU|nr:MAG: hypothetical protein Sylvanvirus26_6 [Sylvanvirus sp.]
MELFCLDCKHPITTLKSFLKSWGSTAPLETNENRPSLLKLISCQCDRTQGSKIYRRGRRGKWYWTDTIESIMRAHVKNLTCDPTPIGLSEVEDLVNLM